MKLFGLFNAIVFTAFSFQSLAAEALKPSEMAASVVFNIYSDVFKDACKNDKENPSCKLLQMGRVQMQDLEIEDASRLACSKGNFDLWTVQFGDRKVDIFESCNAISTKECGPPQQRNKPITIFQQHIADNLVMVNHYDFTWVEAKNKKFCLGRNGILYTSPIFSPKSRPYLEFIEDPIYIKIAQDLIKKYEIKGHISMSLNTSIFIVRTLGHWAKLTAADSGRANDQDTTQVFQALVGARFSEILKSLKLTSNALLELRTNLLELVLHNSRQLVLVPAVGQKLTLDFLTAAFRDIPGYKEIDFRKLFE